MVYLSRIYTKTGDGGQTRLGDNSLVDKDSVRVAAYGEVDELNAVLGFLANLPGYAEQKLISSLQNDLFDLGADLCVPPTKEGTALRITTSHVERLEQSIDRFNERLAPLTSFVLPGGTSASCWLHLGRTVCRRAERAVVTLMKSEEVNQQALIYLNRLSDLLFVLARIANDDGKADVLWVPGRSG
jgi:cob(I)alamin adenosyltransferase